MEHINKVMLFPDSKCIPLIENALHNYLWDPARRLSYEADRDACHPN